MTATSVPERVGILGGTFNPPHIGHLACAMQAWAELDLSRVFLMPAGVPPHKQVQDDPGAPHRAAMCSAAVGGSGELGVCERELRCEGPSYTVDTLREIHARYPGAELTFIAGGDIARGLPQWREPEAVLSLARVAVAERDGVRREEIRDGLKNLRGAAAIEFIDVPRLDISSQAIRRRVSAGLPIRYLVPDAVADYIEQRRLYA